MPEMLDTSCPHCGHTQKVNSKFVGKIWACPSCGEEYGVVAPTADADANDEPFQTFTPDEFAHLRPPPSLLEEETEAIGKDAKHGEATIHAPTHADIGRSFLDFDWNRRAERNFFASFPLFCEKIAELKPLLSSRLQQSLSRRLSDAQAAWQKGQNAGATKGPRLSAADQGLPQLAGTCVEIAEELLDAGRYELVEPLASVAFFGYYIPGLPKFAERVLRAFQLAIVAKLLKKEPVDYEAVLEMVGVDTEDLRRRTNGKRTAPRPEDLGQAVDAAICQYYALSVRNAVAANDTTRAQRIVAPSLCYVARVLGERGQWERVRAWISLCESADPQTVESTRQFGLLVEEDPMAPPGKPTQAEFMTSIENRDLTGAVNALKPWMDTVRARLQNAAKIFGVYRTPESNFLTIDGLAPPGRVVAELNKASAFYFNSDFRGAADVLKRLPPTGDIGTHPLVREWRALVSARMGARKPAEQFFRASVRSGFVLEDTAWNLSVLAASDTTPAARANALQVLDEYLQIERVKLYEGGSIRNASGRHILTNAATTFTLTALSLATKNETFVIDLVLNTPPNELRMYDRLLPLAFVLAATLNDQRQNDLRDRLIGLWARGGETTAWADAKVRISVQELEGYVARTGGDPFELQKLADYLEDRKRYHRPTPLLLRKLAEIYETLGHDKELGARIDLVLTLSTMFNIPERELREAVNDALDTAEHNKLDVATLERLDTWLTRAGKRAWIGPDREHLFARLPVKVPVTDLRPPPPRPEKDEREKAPKPPPTPAARERVTLGNAIASLHVDAEVTLEITTDIIVNDADESDLVVRISNDRSSSLTDIELFLEFKPSRVHAGSQDKALTSPHALKERDAHGVTYETVPIHCPPDLNAVEVSAAIVYSVGGQRRYRQAATVNLAAGPFASVTKCGGGIPHDLYYYGGGVSKKYAHTFKGREGLRDMLIERAKAGNMTAFLDGIKRVGKSSVCANLVYEPVKDVVAIHLDLETYPLGNERENTSLFCQHLLRDIIMELKRRGSGEVAMIPEHRWETEPPTTVFLDGLRQCAVSVAPARLLLMFDEVQALLASVMQHERLREPSKYVGRDFLTMLASMLNDDDRPSQLLFTASERFETIKSGGSWNLFNRMTPINLGFLDKHATGDILAGGVRNTGIRYTPEAVETVWRYLRGYPAHVQQVGDKLMERLRVSNRAIVIPQDVMDVADGLVSESILFDYQCNRDTIGREEAALLEAIFRAQEELYGRRLGIGRGVPARELVNYAPGLESARIPAVKNALLSQQVIMEERDEEGLFVRINGLLMEYWLGRLREERGALREDAFPSRRPSILDKAHTHAAVTPERRGCVVFVDFENIARANALKHLFIGNSIDAKLAAEDFYARLVAACNTAGYDVRDKRVVAPWAVDDLAAYQDNFEVLGLKPVNSLRNVKNSADFVLNNTLMELLSFYHQSGVGTLLLLTADNDFATTITRAKAAGLKAVVWGAWHGRPSHDLKLTADLTENLLDKMYPTAAVGAIPARPPLADGTV
jgi:hypothetical protein